ncbi:chromo domain-containing protein cec-1-like [Mytilus californianus]|uniref:chromo domain-containing protein cec-1-like n=1 Tax=Mytilus californianus TaxID=6549 RepID=UPI00224530F0|nr:chromo domain-containing protein cec-1-like [Mytilus californianus]
MEKQTAACELIYRADFIRKRRVRKGRVEYLVKWKGYPNRDSTWEPEKNILDRTLILDYNQRQNRRKIGKRRKSEVENFKPSGSPIYPAFTDDKNNNRTTKGSHQKRHFLFDKSNENEENDENIKNELQEDISPEESDAEKMDNDPEYKFFNHLNLRKNKDCDSVLYNSDDCFDEKSKRDQMCFDWLSNPIRPHEDQKLDARETDIATELSQKVSSDADPNESDQETVEWVESDLEMDIDNEDQNKKEDDLKGFPDVVATDVTCNSVTVTFFESPSKMGFFESDE